MAAKWGLTSSWEETLLLSVIIPYGTLSDFRRASDEDITASIRDRFYGKTRRAERAGFVAGRIPEVAVVLSKCLPQITLTLARHSIVDMTMNVSSKTRSSLLDELAEKVRESDLGVQTQGSAASVSR